MVGDQDRACCHRGTYRRRRGRLLPGPEPGLGALTGTRLPLVLALVRAAALAFRLPLALRDLHRPRARFGLRTLRQHKRQHSVIKRGLDRVLIGIRRHPERARKAAELTLGEIPGLSLFLVRSLLLAADPDDTVVDAHVDIFLRDAGQFDRDAVGVILNRRLGGRGEPVRHARADPLKRVMERRPELAGFGLFNHIVALLRTMIAINAGADGEPALRSDTRALPVVPATPNDA